MCLSYDDVRCMTNESSAHLRQQRWRVARGFDQPERRFMAKRIQFNAKQPTSSHEFDP
ncbi:unnamed protein product [Protopolystoma xenopodis]|uniref:Uncharacterized protein n=1 Tax=Protopolystoma xenopodis TaxID=117903 RepID=A0A3S5CH78_9PLAT|nr:unnamed protein product [Protopolystoma xenopodis]